MDPLVSVIPGDCMEIRAGKHLEYHTSSGSCIHNHLPFMSVSKKVSVNFISTVHWSHPYYFQVFAFVFIRKISPGIFWHETHGIFFASMFCPSQISRTSVDSYAEVDMVGWSLEPQYGGKISSNKKKWRGKHTECEQIYGLYSSMENWTLFKMLVPIEEGEDFSRIVSVGLLEGAVFELQCKSSFAHDK